MTDGTHPTVLHRLLAEMEALTPEQISAAEPMGKVARSEKEIAPLSEPLRAMYALMIQKTDHFNDLVKRHEAMHEAVTEETPLDKDEHTKLHKLIRPLREEVEVLERMFWQSIRENYEVDPEGNGVGLRADWQVVDMYGVKSASIFDLLGLGALFRG